MFSNWLFLSKNLQDSYINMLAESVGQQPFDHVPDHITGPIVMRGIMKHKLIKQCWQRQRPFVFVDTGYLGNLSTNTNPQACKIYHRMVINDLQHQCIIARPSDRWQRLGLEWPGWRRGRHVIIAAPDDKPCKFYGIDRQAWLDKTVDILRQHTDRPITVRCRTPNRAQRMVTNPLSRDLENCHALVTFNSMAAVEAVLQGVPVFVLAPTHCARPVGSDNLQDIEQPCYADPDLVHQWLCHLAYGQFHVSEMRSGMAMKEIYQRCQYNS